MKRITFTHNTPLPLNATTLPPPSHKREKQVLGLCGRAEEREGPAESNTKMDYLKWLDYGCKEGMVKGSTHYHKPILDSCTKTRASSDNGSRKMLPALSHHWQLYVKRMPYEVCGVKSSDTTGAMHSSCLWPQCSSPYHRP